MKSNSAIVLVAIAALVSAACAARQSKDSPEVAVAQAGPSIRDYYPLAVGNSWTYLSRFGADKAEKTVTITGRKGNYFADDAGGELYYDGEGLRDKKRYMLKVPLAVGNKWLSVVSESSVERYEILDVNAKATVPAGTFGKCLLVGATNKIDEKTEMTGRFYYAPGVGLVKIETLMKAFDKEAIPQTTIELVKYNIKAEK